jgi:phage tail sheath protein FI
MTAATNNVTYDGVDFSVEDIVSNVSIYGATGTVTAIVTRVRPAFQELYEEVRSYIDSFVAAIDLRKENIEKLLQENNPIYANLVSAVKKEGIVLPPSAAIAGVYAATDNERGVWVAPANRSLNSVVLDQKVNVTAEDQANLNVDVTAGKSINAIRSFTGKGTLVWGARTLAGNSNEWRYIPVRRLFNMVEESVKKATEFVVFEPNDKNTWVRTKAMIENFLNQIWRAGGLAGAKAEHAYIVKVGLGETMTSLDILEGRMIIEIHMAAVRPAEFIILRFMHKLQES